jgi:pimeloyl-ACP methyl ester carboxylesterase
VGPLYAPTAKEGMMPLNRLLTTLSRRAPWFLAQLFRRQFSAMAKNPDKALQVLLRQLPDVDREIMSDPDFKASFLADFANSSATWHLAAAQDFRLFARDWGFALSEITTPVHFWQGTLDRNVPAPHAQLLVRATPRATLHLHEGEGHLLVVKRLAEIVRTIAPA